MRHQNKINQLGRTAPHRKAMLSNMASSLIEHKRISTTVAKAKALRGFVEPLITKSKNDTTHSRRMVFRSLQNKQAVSELFREIAPKVGDRPGGYTRIIKTGFRQGDAAEMCIIELVDFNEVYATDKQATTKKTRRSRRGGGGGSKPQAEAAPAAKPEVKEESVSPEAPAEEAAAAEVVEEVTEVAEAAPAEEAKVEETPAEEVPADEEVKAEAAEEVKDEAPAEDASGDEPASDDEEKKADS